MNEALLLMGCVILLCTLMGRYLDRLAVPSLLIFIALGMCFGENGLLRIPFDDYDAANVICSASLIFIMFYGGFGTNLNAARPVVVQSVVLSTLGVAGTAGAVAAFAHLVLGLPWVESFLIGSVISSTDAASVFNILRSKKLALKYHTDSLLEIESGSNDPISYMLTTVAVGIMGGQDVFIPLLLVQQIAIGALGGLLLGKLAIWSLRRGMFPSEQSQTIFVFAVVILSYALPTVLGGNGYLSSYLCGIYMGSTKLPQKRNLVHFFDVVTDVAQVLIFFLLGLLVTPVELPSVLLPALAIMVFLTFLARPAVVSILMLPFRPSPAQVGVVSWAGLRGVASIVFAIMAVLQGAETRYNLFNLVFCIVLLSISLQGSLLPRVSAKLHMIDHTADVSKTFNDYQEESDIDFIKIHLDKNHPWNSKTLKELPLPSDLLVVMIARREETIVPNGSTVLLPGDLLVLAARAFEDRENLSLQEIVVEKGHKWVGRSLRQIPTRSDTLIVMIKRGNETIIPGGSTILQAGDTLVIAQSSAAPAPASA
ncbi:potassium/proton antiporter [Pseudoflavonifractor capillosus]|uniref:potassium/proton antiporter n=1 Tax=Pseudoflavonifractor capillosus TaxID=106588 RepID=UPI001956B1C9|nr:potassium/proton antiporter [Pseudoflavonifractor capillosus]MBM6681836.1 potassium/proton antiporter [Pseudoflavonifractor capillosus]